MMVRTGSTIKGYALGGIYLIALISLLAAAVCVGASNYYAKWVSKDDEVSQKNFADALWWDPANPAAYIKRGESALAAGNFAGAVAGFGEAAKLRPNDFVIWLRLGIALAKLQDFPAAKRAYENSIELAPNYAQPHKLLGMLQLETGEMEEAFVHLRKAANEDSLLVYDVLAIAYEHYGNDGEAIEKALKPENARQLKMLARFLVGHSIMSDRAREFLLSGELSDADKDVFIDLLLAGHNPRLAHDVWMSKSSNHGMGYREGDLMFDGSFESIVESDNVGFGWRTPKGAGRAIAIDTERSRSGARSLLIGFDGNPEAGAHFISQLVLIEPHRNYRLTFSVMSEKLTSGALPTVEVSSANSVLAVSEPIRTTGGKWATISLEFNTGEHDTVSIALKRENCTSDPCPIFGDIYLDDLSLKEIGAPR